jgi:hypothetical protein
MNAPRSAASQTITVAAIHVPTPSMVKPSETRSVTMSETSVAIRATAPRAAEARRRSWLTRNGCMSANTTVKMTAATMKDEALTCIPSRTKAGDEEANGVCSNRHHDAHEEANHSRQPTAGGLELL